MRDLDLDSRHHFTLAHIHSMYASETPRTRFSTEGMFADLPLAHAARAWRDFCAEHFADFEVQVSEDTRFQGSVDGLSLGAGVSIGRLALNAKRVARTATSIQSHRDDRLTLLVNIAGARTFMRQREREFFAEPGCATLFSRGIPFEFCDLPAAPCIQIIMDHEILSSRVAHVEDRFAREARENTDALRLLTNYARLLLDNEQGVGGGLSETAAGHIVDLAALVLGTNRDSEVYAQDHGVRAARRMEVLHHIATGFRDASLSAATVAVRLGVTPRYVHLLLDDSGQSFSRHLNERRLMAARDMLADPRHLHLKIAEVAYAVGFADVSHFNRGFRIRFGMTPSDTRAQAVKSKF